MNHGFFFIKFKKTYLALACSILWQISFAQSPPNNIYKYKNTPLEKVLDEWGKASGISFSYDYDLIKKYTVSQNFTHLSTEDKLIKLLRETALEFKIISKKNILLKRRSNSFYKKYETQICGNISDAVSGTPLPFVNIVLENTGIGTTSDGQGHFALEAPFVKDDILAISFIGYEPETYSPEALKKEPCSHIRLEIKINEMGAVIVRDSPFGNNKNTVFVLPENSMATTIQFQQLGDIGGLVEKDVMRTLQLVPGINGSDESASRLHIRGGTSGQNLLLFDNIPIYHFGHFFGKISAINPDIVEEVSVSKEGYSAKYGGRVSGVIDISGKNKIPEKTGFKIGGSLLSGNANMELPFAKKKAALFIAYRRSFTEFYKSPPFQKFFDQTFQNTRIAEDTAYIRAAGVDTISSLIPKTGFRDLTAKIIWQPNEREHFSASFLQTKDDLTYQFLEGDYFSELDSLSVQNIGFNGKWKHNWKDNFSTTGSFSWSEYSNHYFYNSDLYNRDSAEFALDNFNLIRDYSFQLINTLSGQGQEISLGYQFNKIKEQINNFQKNPGWYEDYRFDDGATGIGHALFIDYYFGISNKFSFNFGSRATQYDLTDKIYFEPRFSIKTYPFKNLIFKIAGGIYYQTINQIVEPNNLNAEDHTWILSRSSENDSTAIFPVVKNQQFSAGISFKIKGWILDAGVYGKEFDGITSHTLRFDNQDVSQDVIGNMNSMGMEISLQKKRDWFFTYASYAYGKAEHKFDYPEYPVPASYNRSHSFTLLQGFIYKNISLSGNLKLASGRPFSQFLQRGEDLSDPDNPGYWIQYENYNGKQLAAYRRLDLTLSWKFSGQIFSGKISLAAMNVFNRNNYMQRFYTLRYFDNTNPPEVVQTDRQGLPFTPNLGIFISIGK